ncbi:MAG: serine acetyltransferase, partial [Oscillospiraceae bacterium]|nr:serine acetyltransferase [Oscillospiraceae bacterium]
MSDLNELVSSFTAAYKNHSASKITDLCYLPDKNCIIEMVELLRKLLFPGYFDGSDTDLENGIEFYTGSLLMQTDKILKQQICRALNTNSKENKSCENKDCEVYFSRACELSYIFLGRIPLLRETLLTDVEAAFEGDPAAKSRHEIIFAYPGIFAVSVYRMAHELYLLDVPLIPRIMSEYAHSITGVDIHPGAEIGKSFFIDHGTGVVIGETAKIGDYVKIYQGVTLGALSTKGGQKLRDLKRHPTLEDEVTVYSSASILGGETVV